MLVDSKEKQDNEKRTNIEKSSAIIATYYLENAKGSFISIDDERIISEDIADKIARAEFLENGYTNQIVEFTTDFTDLKINDIISIYAPSYRIPRELNKDRFIVKRVEHIFQNGFLKSRIKAVRYDL